jgi:dienelactone hydrolase
MTSDGTPDYSPFICDRALMDKTGQSLAYNGGDVGEWQQKLRRKLRAMLGTFPVQRIPLAVRSLWQREHTLGTIEKIVLTTEPGSDAPAYVCLPKGASPPRQWMICVQGHSSGMHNSIAVDFEDETKPMAIEGDRDFGLGCMRRGIAALCLEQRAFGERSPGPPEPNCHEAAMHALMLGRTLIGERVLDVDRAIDYLAMRGDADLNTLGIMGNSGGGTTSVFAAATLPRIRFAMPSCYFCTFEHSIMSIYHCMCNYVPGLYGVAEMADIMGLFAPRPVVIVAGEKDEIFPIKAVRQSFRKLKAVYRAAGAESRCRLVVGAEGHRFYGDLAWPVALKQLEGLKSNV